MSTATVARTITRCPMTALMMVVSIHPVPGRGFEPVFRVDEEAPGRHDLHAGRHSVENLRVGLAFEPGANLVRLIVARMDLLVDDLPARALDDRGVGDGEHLPAIDDDLHYEARRIAVC